MRTWFTQPIIAIHPFNAASYSQQVKNRCRSSSGGGGGGRRSKLLPLTSSPSCYVMIALLTSRVLRIWKSAGSLLALQQSVNIRNAFVASASCLRVPATARCGSWSTFSAVICVLERARISSVSQYTHTSYALVHKAVGVARAQSNIPCHLLTCVLQLPPFGAAKRT
jgi:hypothetical protein